MKVETTWKVGDLARETGVTVRTLHYYEEIGLLCPGGRTPAGHRVYGSRDLERLQQIVSLRDLGMPLDDIRNALDSPDSSLPSTLRRHAAKLRAEIADKERLSTRLDMLAEGMERTGSASTRDLLETIRGIMNFEKYYTPEQLEYLAKRREQFTDEEMAAVEKEWRDLFASLRSAMEAGTDPGDESVQKLLARSDELVELFTGGDEGVRASLGNLWRQEQAPRQMMGIDEDLGGYLRRAHKARHGS